MSIEVITRPIIVNIGPGRPQPIVVTEQQRKLIQAGQVGPRGPAGEEGPAGPAGANGDGQYPVIGFTFADASGVVMTINPDSDVEVTAVELEIETAFDGAGAALQLGTAGDPGLLMDPSQNDPGDVAVYASFPRVRVAAGTELVLTISPGTGASQGTGTIVVQATPIT